MTLLRPYCIVMALAFASLIPHASAATSTPFKLLTGVKNVIVWQEFHPWLMITEDLPDGRTCYFHSHTSGSKLMLKPAMPGAWTPIGSAIKWLMFVHNYNGIDRLMAHNVDYHEDFVVVPSAQDQVGCGMQGNKCVFGQYRAIMAGDHYPVDLVDYDVASGAFTPACTSDSGKSQFAHDGSLIVYRANLGSDVYAIYGHYFDLTGEFVIAERDGIEPSVCGPLVAWAEANGPGFDIVAKNLETGEIRTVAYTTANPPCPEVGRGTIFWQDARNPSTAPDIYGYDWDTGGEFPVTTAAGSQSRLRVCDDLVTWVTGITNYQTLWAATINQPVKVRDLRATMVSADSVGLAWTSVGATSNPPVTYDLRTRTDGPITDSNWSASTQVTGLTSPKSPGESEAFTALSLAPGHCWFALKVRLQDGSYTPMSNVICVYVSDAAAAFNADEGAYISFTGIVTGTQSDRSFCCQRTSGIGAVNVTPRIGDVGAQVGQSVTVTGILSQDPNFIGPILRQATVTGRVAAGMPDVVGMSNKALGGFDPRWGGTIEKGAPNFWMRVRTWGRVSGLATSGGCSFYINDGSGQGVYVTSPYTPPSGLRNGVFVTADGISCLSRTAGRCIRVIPEDGITPR